MRRILLTIEYDGSCYSGWQKQPDRRTIQGEIEQALFRILGQKIEVFGSGRTDAGVHALNQKAHFDLDTPIPISKLASIINNQLPDDIVIKSAEEVANDFHARFSLTRKVYSYTIFNSQYKDAFLARRVGRIEYLLDERKMAKAGKLLIGEHNFKGFASANTCTDNFVRTIYDLKVERDGDFIYVTVEGSGFLYNMVRIIVGTLVDYSLGNLTLDDIQSALKNQDRSKSGRTMVASGLYLKDAIY